MLTTKLFAPTLREKLVIRGRLFDKLSLGLTSKLALISAPAGYGKTTAVLDWLRHIVSKYTWLSLDHNDNDPSRFLSYLVAALQKVAPELVVAVAGLMGGPQQPGFETLLEILINDLAKSQEQLILVLDDYHLITNKSIHAGVGFLIEYKPPALHLVLTTREDPPLALARMRVRNELTEIRASDLMFRQEETERFMRSTMGLNLTERVVQVLEGRTEGWIAGLQLAAISLQGKDEQGIEAFIQSFGGSHRYVIDYLVEEVLQEQSAQVRRFLCQTAALVRFCPALCEAVTGHHDSRELIKQLESLSLFIIPLDENRRWYRYHHLFGNVLSGELAPREREEVYYRAARWFESAGLVEEGIKYALGAKDMDLAGRLMAKAAPGLFQRGEMTTILEWTGELTPEVLLGNVELALYRAWACFYTGQGVKSAQLITRIELEHGQLPGKTLGRLTALKGWLDYSEFGPNGGELARKALKYLTDEDNFRLMALILLGEYQRNLGDATGSMLTFRAAYELSRQADYSFASLGALVELAVALDLTGQRSEAAALCQDTIDKFTQGREPTPLLGFVYTRMGAFCFTANQLDLAHTYLEQGVELCRRLTTDRVMGGEGKITLGNVQLALGQMDLARVLFALGQGEVAWNILTEVRGLVQRAQILPFFGKLGALEAEFLLHQGEVEEAASRLNELSLSPGAEHDPAREEEYLVLARVMLAKGKLKEAKDMLSQMEKSALLGDRQARLINIYIIQAGAEQSLGKPDEAVSLLEKALRIALPGRYLRPFIDAGGEIAKMLRKMRPVSPAFVESILSAFSGSGQETVAAVKANLVDGLSEREREILRLVAQGLSNGEIANKLYITPGTTKWHLNNIFSKLGVNSRTKAVSLAQELKLL